MTDQFDGTVIVSRDGTFTGTATGPATYYKQEEKSSENSVEMVESTVLAPQKQGVHRFLPGNAGGPGRPKKEVKEAHFRDLIRMNTTDDEFLAVWRSIVEGAAAGHNHKQKLFCAYLLGNPTQFVETNSSGLVEILAMLGPAE